MDNTDPMYPWFPVKEMPFSIDQKFFTFFK